MEADGKVQFPTMQHTERPPSEMGTASLSLSLSSLSLVEIPSQSSTPYSASPNSSDTMVTLSDSAVYSPAAPSSDLLSFDASSFTTVRTPSPVSDTAKFSVSPTSSVSSFPHASPRALKPILRTPTARFPESPPGDRCSSDKEVDDEESHSSDEELDGEDDLSSDDESSEYDDEVCYAFEEDLEAAGAEDDDGLAMSMIDFSDDPEDWKDSKVVKFKDEVQEIGARNPKADSMPESTAHEKAQRLRDMEAQEMSLLSRRQFDFKHEAGNLELKREVFRAYINGLNNMSPTHYKSILHARALNATKTDTSRVDKLEGTEEAINLYLSRVLLSCLELFHQLFTPAEFLTIASMSQNAVSFDGDQTKYHASWGRYQQTVAREITKRLANDGIHLDPDVVSWISAELMEPLGRFWSSHKSNQAAVVAFEPAPICSQPCMVLPPPKENAEESTASALAAAMSQPLVDTVPIVNTPVISTVSPVTSSTSHANSTSPCISPPSTVILHGLGSV